MVPGPLRTFQLCVRPPHPWPRSRAGERGTESCCLSNGSRISSLYFVVFNNCLCALLQECVSLSSEQWKPRSGITFGVRRHDCAFPQAQHVARKGPVALSKIAPKLSSYRDTKDGLASLYADRVAQFLKLSLTNARFAAGSFLLQQKRSVGAAATAADPHKALDLRYRELLASTSLRVFLSSCRVPSRKTCSN